MLFYIYPPVNIELLCNPTPSCSAAPYAPHHNQTGLVIFLALCRVTLVRHPEQTG